MVDYMRGTDSRVFDIPTDNLFAAPVFIEDIKKFANEEKRSS